MAVFHIYSHNKGSSILFPLTIIVVILWILFIVELALGKKAENEYNAYEEKYPDGRPIDGPERPSYPMWRWTGQDSTAAYDFVWRGTALLVEIIHLPVHHVLLWRQRMHPVAALATSLLMGCLWVGFAFTGILVVLGKREISTEHNGLANLVAFGHIPVIILYWAYSGYSACHVHQWRRERKIVRRSLGAADVSLKDIRRSEDVRQETV